MLTICSSWSVRGGPGSHQEDSGRADLRVTVEETFRDGSGDPETETRDNSEIQREKETQRGAPGKPRDRDTEG